MSPLISVGRKAVVAIAVALIVCFYPPTIHGQNVQATWDGGSSGSWWINPDQFDPTLSNWSMSGNLIDYNYPNTVFSGAGFTFFDVMIDNGSTVSVPAALPISISNLTLTGGATVDLSDGTDFILVNAGDSATNGVVDGGFLQLTNVEGNFLTELFLDGNIRFTGGGQMLLNDSSENVVHGNNGFNVSSRMTLEDYTVEGAGNLGNSELTIVIEAGSLIRATGNNALIIDPIDGANGLFNNGVLQAGGGTLRLFDGGFDNRFGVIQALSFSTVEIVNASVTGGTFESSGNGAIRALSGASLIGPITNNARLEIPIAPVILTGNLTNTNLVLIGDGSTSGALLYDIDTLLDGGGEVVLGNNVGNQLNAVFNTTGRLTNVDNTIRGAGLIGGRITNQGTIRADQATPLIFQPADVAGGGINQGVMEAVGGGTLQLHISTVDNAAGEVRALGGGTVLLSGSATIQGGLVNVGDGSRLELSDGTVDATLNNSSTGIITTVQGKNNRLTGAVNNSAGGLIQVQDGTRLNLDQAGSYTNAGTLRLEGQGPLTSFGGTRLLLDGTVTLQGGGDIDLTNSVSNTIEGSAGGAAVDTLVNQDQRIHGSGNLGQNTLEIVNRGTIEADQPFIDSEAFGTIVIDPRNATGTLTNEGTLRATQGGRLDLRNGTYLNTNGLIEANDGSTIEMKQAVVVRGGTIRTNGTGQVIVSQEVTFDGIGMTVDADLTIDAPQGNLILQGAIGNQKTIRIDGARMGISGNVTLSGGGQVVLADTPASNLNPIIDSLSDQLVNLDNTISGAGTIASLSIMNLGTIRADGTNPLIYQVPNDGFDNQGNLEVTGSGGMQLIGGVFSTSGNVQIDAGSHLFRDGDYVQTAGKTNVNGTLEVSFLKTIDIQGGTLGGNGTIIGQVALNGTVAPGNSTGILNFEDDVQLMNSLDLEIAGFQVDGAAPDLGTINVGTDPSLIGFDQMNVFAQATIDDGVLFNIDVLPTYAPQVGDFFDLVTADAITQLGTLDFAFNNANAIEFDYQILTLFDPDAGFDRQVVRLMVTGVPEPAATALFLTFLVAATPTRRRRTTTMG